MWHVEMFCHCCQIYLSSESSGLQFTGINIEIVINTGFNNFNETHCWANYCVEYRSASPKRWCYPKTFRGYFWIGMQ